MNIGPILFSQTNLFTIYLELFTLFLIFLISLFIYLKTSKIFSLTQHIGINYFRKGFLWISFGSLLSIINFIFIFLKLQIFFGIQMKYLFIFSSSVSLVGIIYLLLSLFYKNNKIINFEKRVIILIPLFIFFLLVIGNRIFLTILHLSLFFYLISYIFLKQKKNKFFSKIFRIYFFLFLFWIINSLKYFLNFQVKYYREFSSIFTILIFIYILYIFSKIFVKNEK